MGQTDNICLAVYFQMFSQIICLRGGIFLVVALEKFIFVLHCVFSDMSSAQLEQDMQGKIYCNMKFIDLIGLFCTALRS